MSESRVDLQRHVQAQLPSGRFGRFSSRAACDDSNRWVEQFERRRLQSERPKTCRLTGVPEVFEKIAKAPRGGVLVEGGGAGELSGISFRAEVTRRDVHTLVEPIAERGAPVMANRVLAVVRRMLNFGVRRDWIEANPASLIAKPGRENSRDRVLSDDELRALWRLLERFPATHEKQALAESERSTPRMGARSARSVPHWLPCRRFAS